MPLTFGVRTNEQTNAPAAEPNTPPPGKRVTLRKGRNFLSIDPERIWEKA